MASPQALSHYQAQAASATAYAELMKSADRVTQRDLTPANEEAAPTFDSDDIVDLFKHAGCSAQELADLNVMLSSVIEHARADGRQDAFRAINMSRGAA